MSETTSSLSRMLAILDLYTMERSEWTVDAIAGALGYPGSTAYRYVRELTRVGLLAKLPGATYVVGAKVIELEVLVRHADPLARVARPFLQDLATQTGCSALLSNVYGQHLINVAHEDGLESIDLTYLRGTPLPWFRGAPGKAAAAFLPTARVRMLFEKHECGGQFDETRWHTCRSELKRIRNDGYSVSAGELDPDIVGFGVPLMPEGEVIGSISLACSRRRAEMLSRQGLADLLRSKAQQLEGVVRDRRTASLGIAAESSTEHGSTSARGP
jgi:DNA-binding IclR family transcriptional regulator